MLGQGPSIVVVPNDLPPKPLREFVDYATARPGQLNYANAGNGTSQTRGLELLKEDTGIDMVGVGYEGYPAVVPDLITGRLQFAMMPFGIAAPQVKAGKMRALVVLAPGRSKQFPDLPTMAEAGFPESPVIAWSAFVAHAAGALEFQARGVDPGHGQRARDQVRTDLRHGLAGDGIDLHGMSVWRSTGSIAR